MSSGNIFYGTIIFKDPVSPVVVPTVVVPNASVASVAPVSNTPVSNPTKIKNIYYLYKIISSEPTSGSTSSNISFFHVSHLAFEFDNNTTLFFPIDGTISDDVSLKHINCTDEVLEDIRKLYNNNQIEYSLFSSLKQKYSTEPINIFFNVSGVSSSGTR